MLLKFRHPNNILGDFTHYADVDESKIKRYIGPIAPVNHVSFRISDPIHQDLQSYFNRMENTWIMNIPYDFYFVEGNYIVILKMTQTFILHHNITDFRIGEINPFVPTQNMNFYLWCYFDYDNRVFIPIGGLNTQFAVTTLQEIQQRGLAEINF